MKTLAVAIASFILALGALDARAERADRDKPVNFSADDGGSDTAKGITELRRNVVITQGTFRLSADLVRVITDKEGYHKFNATGTPVAFREKREGAEEFIEGFAARTEFDQRRNLVEMFGNARLRRGTDEFTGEYISYNTETEIFQISGAPPGKTAAPGESGRVRGVLQPRPRAGDSAKSPKPADSAPSDKAGKAS